MVNELKKNIIDLFPKKPLPKNKLNDAVYLYKYGKIEQQDLCDDKWVDWTKITDNDISKCDILFNYLDFYDCLYFLPRYMIWILDDIDNVLDPDIDRTSVDIPLFKWIYTHWSQIQDSTDLKRVTLIKQFLAYCNEDEDYSISLFICDINIDFLK